MTDRAAFLATICERPDDDAPRLVFADRLDDWGEAARAAFIRRQVWGQDPLGELACRRYDFRAKINHAPDVRWLAEWNSGPVPEWIEALKLPVAQDARYWFKRGFIYWFKRGFIESLNMPAGDWLAHGDELSWSPLMTDPCPQFGYAEGEPHVLCARCRGKGRIPRPCPETAQPIREVRLTTPTIWQGDGDRHQWLVGDPERQRFSNEELNAAHKIGESLIVNLLRCRWPAVEKWKLPPPT